MSDLPDALPQRERSQPCDELFPRRWSPRAMDGRPLDRDTLMTLLEAARWAPSSFNGQPWRFVYGIQGTPAWDTLFGLLGEYNQTWCARGGALLAMLSRKEFEHNGKPDKTHLFSTGAAYENLALQGAMMGLVVHGMAGFDFAAARQKLNVPDVFEVAAMAVVGRHADPEVLAEDLRDKEQPSGRKPLTEIAHEGAYPT